MKPLEVLRDGAIVVSGSVFVGSAVLFGARKLSHEIDIKKPQEDPVSSYHSIRDYEVTLREGQAVEINAPLDTPLLNPSQIH